MWQNEKKNLLMPKKNGPMSKNEKKLWNLVVSKPENNKLTREKKIKFGVSTKRREKMHSVFANNKLKVD